MDFSTYLKKNSELIDKQLLDYFNQWEEDAKRINPALARMVRISNEASMGGKRLRGVLVRLGFELAGGRDLEETLKPAAAFEIFQTAILAHDDIIDKSLTRRGRPTMYQALGGDHYAISQTICLGDSGFFQAVQIIAEANFPAERKIKACQSFAKSMLETALGEMLDIEIPHLSEVKNEQDALTIFYFKTARYTIIGPMQLGAILAGASEDLLEQIEQFGRNLGIAFQIQDDILGVFGDERTLGKSVTSDVEEGKNTLLISYALGHTNSEQKEFLKAHYGKGKIKDTQFMKFKEIFQNSGALDYSRSKALEYVDQAKKAIPVIATKPDQAKLLNELADFLIVRQK